MGNEFISQIISKSPGYTAMNNRCLFNFFIESFYCQIKIFLLQSWEYFVYKVTLWENYTPDS